MLVISADVGLITSLRSCLLYTSALDKAGLAALRAQTDQIYVSDDVLDYIVRLVAGTRTLPELVQGCLLYTSRCV